MPTLREIAVKMHEAEETEDDLSFMEAQDALEQRIAQAGTHGFALHREFHIIYREVWRERMGDAPVRRDLLDPVPPAKEL